jgi:protein TonB
MQTGMTAASGKITVKQPPIPWAASAADDRLSSTLFLAGLFHAILILGVTFSGDRATDEPTAATNLDVVLLARDHENKPAPEHADLLAQQNLTGAGNTTEPKQLQTASNRTQETGKIGPDQEGSLEKRHRGQQTPENQLLVVTASSSIDAIDPNFHGNSEPVPQRQRAAPPGSSISLQILSELAPETRLSNSRDRELIISANTRESRIAAYLSSWKVKVERVGTLNFPNVERRTPSTGHPTLEVVINANGDLQDVIVRHSSGERILDQAAMDILRSAAPFEPFPEFLKSDYDVLRFAYEWRFTRGAGVSKITSIGGS